MDSATETTSTSVSRQTLSHKIVGDIRGQFIVPAYQRGYRWDKDDVSRLLNDIWESQNRDYSLQPIVVKLDKQGSNDTEHEWELIDGQQRLTTLYLILQYMRKHAGSGRGAPYRLRYETHIASQEYLDTLDESRHTDNSDFYHLFKANLCIHEWFHNHGDDFAVNNAANKIHGYLFNSVRVIWYNAGDVNGTKLFTRLNVGRIPLTDAELIKATLLSEARGRLPEIAAQWDAIERDLHRADTWAFVAGLTANDGDEKYPTRISLLMDTIADERTRPEGKRPRYHTFDTLRGDIEKDYSEFWKKVVALHAQILGWEEEPAIYNKIGFLVLSGDVFGAISLAAKGKKKSEFEKFLLGRIREHLKVQDSDLEELHYEEKQRGRPKLLQLLLLMNVETATQSKLRFPFFRHVGQHWSLEHIHAQNAETLNKAEQWKIWLGHHGTALNSVVSSANNSEIVQLKAEMDAAIAEIDAGNSGRFSSEQFNALSARVLSLLNLDAAPDHSIRNMALLSSGHNSSLGNSVFEVKRRMILDLDRKGAYVPICTRNTFLKYYAEANAQQPHFWGEADKVSYLKEVRSKLRPYLIESSQMTTPQ